MTHRFSYLSKSNSPLILKPETSFSPCHSGQQFRNYLAHNLARML